ncbi:PhoD-like phosphatase-domain-containing protein [Trametes elegans]|nr:PhoD-like phosphatase-domain-containing protein [Trametes elegans]
MMIVLALSACVTALVAQVGATELFDRNLAYSSPFVGTPQLSHNTRALEARHVEFVKRRLTDTQSSDGIIDEHYPTFYGGDFRNSPFIYNGGINFTHSVASGDPLHNSLLLWTRAVPLGEPEESIPVCVSFKIFDNPGLQGHPLDSRNAFTSYDVDFTLKVEASNLQPDTTYWYQFADCTNPKTVSPIGKTRTIADPDTPAHLVNKGKPLTLAVFSCARYQDGYFNAYGVAALNTSADIFVHLGDYIYESLGDGAPIGRATLGRELATIEDYRGRLNQYRTDASLDDHEVADQAWKAGTADSNDTVVGCSFSPSGACFTDRKLATVRTYHEWMPIRQVDPDDKLRVWRNFLIGKLLDLTMLDTRQYDRDITDDAWDGYRANRNRVLDHLYDNDITNTIILAGDSHANWASDLARPNDTITYARLPQWDPDIYSFPEYLSRYNAVNGDGAIGVEFAGTAVSSTSTFGAGILPEAADAISRNYVRDNDHLQWSEGSYRGFFTLTLNTTTATATYYAMRNVSSANLDAFASAIFVVHAGENRLSRPVAGGNVAAGVLKVQA